MDQLPEAEAAADELQPRSASENADDTPVNPRKRKKSSRACDFCHVNHQPCDNAKPRCSYCERHNKSCLYLRPQKKRGPAQGYRSALHTLRESAAAWGAALNLVPSLGPVLEGYLKQPEGQRLIRAVKDPQQQEFFIQAWQQSGVFKAFFGDEAAAAAGADGPDTSSGIGGGSGGADGLPLGMQPPLHLMPDLDTMIQQQQLVPILSPSRNRKGGQRQHSDLGNSTLSLSDIVAKDAARSAQGFDQILGSLGFAPNETLDDFLAMSFDPEPLQQPSDLDPLPGSEMDQKAYYELLMGKQFI